MQKLLNFIKEVESLGRPDLGETAAQIVADAETKLLRAHLMHEKLYGCMAELQSMAETDPNKVLELIKGMPIKSKGRCN